MAKALERSWELKSTALLGTKSYPQATHKLLWANLATVRFLLHKPKKIRDLFRSRVFINDRLFFDQKTQSLADAGLQRIANTLSTEAPTVFGGNFDNAVENR